MLLAEEISAMWAASSSNHITEIITYFAILQGQHFLSKVICSLKAENHCPAFLKTPVMFISMYTSIFRERHIYLCVYIFMY